MRRLSRFLSVAAIVGLLFARTGDSRPPLSDEPKADHAAVRAVLKKYCLNCHSTKDKKGSLDLERFATVDDIRKDLKPWISMIEQIGRAHV